MRTALGEHAPDASSIAATAALLSPPRIAALRLRTMPSSTTGSIASTGGTVSRWAQKKSGSPSAVGSSAT